MSYKKKLYLKNCSKSLLENSCINKQLFKNYLKIRTSILQTMGLGLKLGFGLELEK